MFLMLLLSKTPVMVHFEGGKKGPNALGVLELMDQRGKLNLFLGQTISLLLLSVVLLNPLASQFLVQPTWPLYIAWLSKVLLRWW